MVPLSSAKMPSYFKEHLWLSYYKPSLVNTKHAFSDVRKAFLNFNDAFLHVITACDAISPDFTLPEQDRVKIPSGRHFRTG